MKTKTKSLSVIGIVLLAIIVGLVVMNLGQSSGLSGGSWHTVAMGSLAGSLAGIPDAYGNQILGVQIYQNTTGSWVVVTSIDSTTFTNGSTLSVPANQKTIIYVIVSLNVTFAPDIATAKARTRVYITIGGVVTSGLMVQYGGALLSNWLIYFWYPSSTSSPTSLWTPATDTTYSTLVQYQAYY